MKIRKYLTSLLAAAMLCPSYALLSVSAEDSFSETAYIAEKAQPSELTAEDRFVIVFGQEGLALSPFMQESRFAGLPVTEEGDGLTQISGNVAVFQIEKNDAGLMALRSDAGYLTAGKNGGSVYFSQKRTDKSLWESRGDFLCCPDAGTNGQTVCLEYYNGFTTYKMADGADPAPFTLSFFKLDDSFVPQHSEGGYRLPVFETSDIHGYMVDTSGDEYDYRLAFVADKVNDKRNETGSFRTDTVMLLDGGDIYQGATLSNLLGGKPLSEAFVRMQYDAAALGNHEFDWGIANVVDDDATMQDSGHENTVPVIIADLYKDGVKTDFTKDYVILNKTAVDAEGNELPVKVGVIGYADNYASSIMTKMFTGLGYEIREDYDALRGLASDLKQTEGCDAVVVLAHSEAAYIADQIGACDDIDLVLGGHTHISDIGANHYELEYAQPSGQCKAYVYAELVFDTDESGAPVFRDNAAVSAVSVTRNTALLKNTPANADELDPEIVEISEAAIESMRDVLNETVGRITVSADRFAYLPGSGDRASASGNWHTSMIARAVGAEIGFFNQSGIRDNILIPEGEDHADVTLSDLYTLFPFSNQLYCYELTYDELLTLFQYALTKSGSTLFSLMSGIDCYFTDRTVNALVLNGKTLYANGEWYADKETKIRIAASEFLCTTDRPDSGLHNPLVEWGATDRLISNDVTDIDGVTEVLRDEAAANGGYLAIDTKAHFINSAYTVPEYEKQDDAEVSGTSETAGNTTTVTQTTAAAAANTPSANTGSANASAPKTADRSPLSVMFLLFAGMTAALSAFMLRKKKSSTDKRSL